MVGDEFIAYIKGAESADCVRYVGPVAELREEMEWQMSYTFLMPTFADFYDNFIYSDTDNAYVYHGEDGLESNSPMEYWTMTFTDIAIKFINGKVACITADRVAMDDGIYKWIIYDYGTTNVVLPTTYIDAAE